MKYEKQYRQKCSILVVKPFHRIAERKEKFDNSEHDLISSKPLHHNNCIYDKKKKKKESLLSNRVLFHCQPGASPYPS